MALDKTLKQKMNLLQKLKENGLKEDKQIINLSFEEIRKLELTDIEQEYLVYLRQCIQNKNGIIAFFTNDSIDEKMQEGSK